MRGDWFWPALIWTLLVGVLCWWSPPFGRQECPDHTETVRAIAPAEHRLAAATHKRETVTRVGHPVEPIREEWGEWD